MLIEDSILRAISGFAQRPPDGRGAHRQRSACYAHIRCRALHPMLGGDKDPQEIVASKEGLPPPILVGRWTSLQASSCFGQRGLLGGKREDPLPRQRGDHHRQWPLNRSSAWAWSAMTCAWTARGHLRQGGQSVPRGRGPAHVAHRRPDGGRNGLTGAPRCASDTLQPRPVVG